MRKFLCSNVQRLKVLCKKVSGLSMFSEIGKLRARKNIPLLEPGSVLKDYDVHRVQTLQKKLGLRLGQHFPKHLIRLVIAICLVRCNINCKELSL